MESHKMKVNRDQSGSTMKGEIKRDLIDYFDSVKFEIDIQSQTKLINLTDPSPERDFLLKLNLELVNKVDELCTRNLLAVDNYYSSLDRKIYSTEHDLKAGELNGYCIFFNSETLDEWFVKDNQVGLLLVSDWYLDQNQKDYLRFDQSSFTAAKP
jgi:hypothetical protein